MRAMGTIERIQILVVATEQICRERQPLEIRAVELSLLVGQRERLPRGEPGAPLEALAAEFERAARGDAR